MINKNKFSIKNTKKVLHKVGKQWVVVSAVLLGLVAGGAAVNETANAANVSSAPVASTNAPSKKASIINKVKANKGNVVTDAVKATNEYVKSGTPNYSSASAAYNGLASMAKTNNLSQFSNEVSLGNPYSENSNTWMGEFNTAKSYANELNSPRLNGYIAKINGILNNPVSNNKKLQNININKTFSKDIINHSSLAPMVNGKISYIENNFMNQLPKAQRDEYNNNPYKKYINISKPSINYDSVSINGNVRTNASINQIINNGYVPITFTSGTASLNGALISGLNVTLNQNAVNNYLNQSGLNGKLQQAEEANSFLPKLKEALNNYPLSVSSESPLSSKEKAKVTYFHNNPGALDNLNTQLTQVSNEIKGFNGKINGAVQALQGDIQQKVSNIEQHISIPLTNISTNIYFNKNFSTSDIINLLDGKNGFSNDINGQLSSEAHTAIESAAAQQMNGNSAKASNYLDKAADAIKAGNMMLGSADMTNNYNGLVNQLAALPNAQANKSANSVEANDLYTAATDADSLASDYQNDTNSASYDNPADKESVVSYLDDAANQARRVASDLDASTPNAHPSDNKNVAYIDFDGDSAADTTVSGLANNTSSISAPSGYHFKDNKSTENIVFDGRTYEFSVASNSVTPNNNQGNNNNNSQNQNNTNNASTNTNNGAYVPYIAPDNFASSVAAQMNGNNSASASSNASTSASASSNNVAPATKKHAVNYAKVVKALQLHTNPNFTKRNGVAVVKPGSAFKIEKSVKAHNGALRYEVKYNKKNYFITANKRFVNAYYKAAKHANHANHSVNNYVHYRYAKVIKHLRLHTSAKFTKRNGVKAVRPGAEFHINRIVKNHGLVRYEVRHNHKNYFITASHHYTVNAYVQKYNFRKHGYKAVRVIKPLDEYRKLGFSKRNFIRHFYRGSVLPVKKVVTIASGEMTRLQLTNGRYVSANKDFVEPIR